MNHNEGLMDLQGILLGIIFAIFTFAVNKMYVFTQLYLHKKRYPNEKILFFYSVPWQGTLMLPATNGFCLGSIVIPLYQFPNIDSIFFVTQYNKHLFLLVFLSFFIAWCFGINYIYIFTRIKIKIKIHDKFKIFMRYWINNREVLYKDIVSTQIYKDGIYIKLNNDELIDLRCLNPKKIYQKLQLLLNEEKENES